MLARDVVTACLDAGVAGLRIGLVFVRTSGGVQPVIICYQTRMTRERKIADRPDLVRIHEGGEGYVLYPFGRKLHSARCSSVPGMALNPEEPRWFAPDTETAVAYQRDRLARYKNAQSFERVRCCEALVSAEVIVERDGARLPQPISAGLGDRQGEDSGEGRLWTSRATKERSLRLELWTIRRTPFETDQSPQQKAMVRALTPRLAQLQCGRDDRLHGMFTSDEMHSRQPDAENVTFFNFGVAPFSGATRTVAFERSYAPAPSPPSSLEVVPRFHHSWEVLPADAPFEHWDEHDTVASWSNVPIDLSGDLGLEAWRALREHPERVEVSGRLSAADRFGIRVTLFVPNDRRPSIVKAIKGLVDGPLAAFQRVDALPAEVMAKMLGRRWARPVDERTLTALVAAHQPPAVLPRAPFNGNGLDPCDELCVVGVAQLRDSDATCLSGHVFRVTTR